MKKGDRVKFSGFVLYPEWTDYLTGRLGTIKAQLADGWFRVEWDGSPIRSFRKREDWDGSFLEVVTDKKTTSESGQAAIESALILPIFFFVVIGIFDFGQFLYFNQTLTMRLEAGARYAAASDHRCNSPIASVCDSAVNIAVFNNPTGTGLPVLANFTAANVSASVTTHQEAPAPAWFASAGVDRVTVSVSDYPIDLLFFPKFHRKASASQPIEWYQCYKDCK